mmetsp:Transcript_30200/g.99958  ORF Transcript_30200/g.99958 Transcript_30200/m.99958 type:complete len:203 (-) Transcript_30200:8-616(-)
MQGPFSASAHLADLPMLLGRTTLADDLGGPRRPLSMRCLLGPLGARCSVLACASAQIYQLSVGQVSAMRRTCWLLCLLALGWDLQSRLAVTTFGRPRSTFCSTLGSRPRRLRRSSTRSSAIGAALGNPKGIISASSPSTIVPRSACRTIGKQLMSLIRTGVELPSSCMVGGLLGLRAEGGRRSTARFAKCSSKLLGAGLGQN